MALIGVFENADAWTATYDGTTREYEGKYQVVFDIQTGSAVQAINAVGVPRIGDQYSHGADSDTAYCDRLACANESSEAYNVFRVTAHFSTRGLPSVLINDNPLLRPPVYSSGSNFYTREAQNARRVVFLDGATFFDTPCMNTAKMPIDPPIEVEDPHPVLRIVRNEPYDIPAIMATKRAYEGKLNSSSFSGADAETVICLSIDFGEAVENGIQYLEVGYEFEYSPNGFGQFRWDRGLHELTVAGNVVRIYDNNGIPIEEPVYLDGNGGAFADGSGNLIQPDDVDRVGMTFYVHDVADFNALGLGI